MTHKTLAGFTIGPIGDTLKHAKKTRELWMGSYLFSWFMENLCTDIKNKLNKKIKFLSPHFDDPGEKTQAGLFPDRFIIESTTLSKEEIRRTIEILKNANFNKLVDLIITETKADFKKEIINNSKEYISGILKSYFQLNYVVLDNADIKPEEEFNIVNGYLNTLEESRTICNGKCEHTCERCEELPGIIRLIDEKKENKFKNFCPVCFLQNRGNYIKEIKEKVSDEKKFYIPSITRISAKELFNSLEDAEKFETILKIEEEDIGSKNFNDLIGTTKEDLLQYHSYAVMVQADGDNLGQLAEKINDPSILSKRLYEFSQKAENLVKEYKGQPIFLGGDDLLVLMPVICEDKTVFRFVEDLKEIYSETLNKNEDKQSTISVAINMFYYKYPLSLVLKNTASLLFEKAKKERNTLALCLTKHSGQQINLTFSFNDKQIRIFNELLRNVDKNENELLKGIIHNLVRYKTLLSKITKEEELKNFFDNNFNEVIHTKFKTFIDEIEKALASILDVINNAEPPISNSSQDKKSEAINEFLEMLKVVNFLKEKRHD